MQFDDASRALVEFAASRHNAFSSSEAAAFDFDAQRLRRARQRGEIRNIYPRVWALTSLANTPGQLIRAATLSSAGGVASLLSAAWLHGWVDSPPPTPQVWVPNGTRVRSSAAVHKATGIERSHDVTLVDHIETLNKAATLCLLGSVADRDLVEKALDEFLRTDSERWLDATIDRMPTPKPRGVRQLMHIRNNPRRTAGVTDSWLERVVVKLVALRWMPPITLQEPVTVEGRLFRLDIACPDLLLGVEAHGRSFHWGRGKEDADNVRDLLLGTVGWKLIYVTYSQVRNPDQFVRRFAQTARTRAAQLGVRLDA